MLVHASYIYSLIMQIALAFLVMMVGVPHYLSHDVMVLTTVQMAVMKQTVVSF